MIPSISPQELRDELTGPNPPAVIDVREAHELEISALAGVVHIPLGDLPGCMDQLPKDGNYVVMCRVGGRSAHATMFLLGNGFSKVRNMTSGINGWARTVDRSLPEY